MIMDTDKGQYNLRIKNAQLEDEAEYQVRTCS